MIDRWVEPYVGLPYAQDRSDGEDCWSLVCRVYEDRLGIKLPRYGDVDARDLQAVATVVDKDRAMGPWVRVAEPAPYDVVVMWAHRRRGTHEDQRFPAHCGVMVGRDELLHVQKGTAAVAERIDAPRVRGRIVGFYRHRECAA